MAAEKDCREAPLGISIVRLFSCLGRCTFENTVRKPGAAAMLSAAAFALAVVPPSSPPSFTVYTPRVELRAGQVHNKMLPPMALPKDVLSKFSSGEPMAVSGYDVDIVRTGPDGAEEQVPLYDHYLHHYILYVGSESGLSDVHSEVVSHSRLGDGLKLMKPSAALAKLQEQGKGRYTTFGGASGAEFRHNPHRYAAPFRSMVASPETWSVTLHAINVRNSTVDDSPSPLLQCPCTPQRVINATAGTIDGETPHPPFGYCSKWMAEERNPSCSLSTYVGGWRCCEDGVFLIDTASCSDPQCTDRPKSSIRFKVTFYFDEPSAASAAPLLPLHSTACCDASSDLDGDGNIEYDVPPCAAGTPPHECTHVVRTVQPLDWYYGPAHGPRAQRPVKLAYAAPHLHVTGISLELQDAVTNATVCRVTRGDGVTYGGSAAAGSERAYLVGLRPCIWDADSAPEYARSHPMRTIAVYNATTRQTGVMSLWLMTAASVVGA